MVDYVKGLHQVGDDVWAWLAPDGSWGWSNAGLIAGADASLLVDTLFDLPLTREMLVAMEPITDSKPITDLVNTHANGDHCFGNELLAPSVTIHAGRDVAEHLSEETPELLANFVTADLGPILTPFARKCFGAFDFNGITVRPPDTEVVVETDLHVGGRAVRVLPLGPAHTSGDVAIFVPDANVLFAGDLLFIEGTPIMWAGPAENWIAACDALLGTGADVIVPGHGPVTNQQGVVDVRDYIQHVLDEVRAAHAAGKTWWQAADEIDLDRFAGLIDAERVVVTTHVIYRDLDPSTPALDVIDLFTAMAQWGLNHATAPTS